MNVDGENSDCELIEQNISTITIPDSQEDDVESQNKDAKDDGPQNGGEPEEYEDGELLDEDLNSKFNGGGYEDPVFEILFHHSNAYNALGDTVLQALQSALNTKSPNALYDFAIVEDLHKGVSIKAYSCSLSTRRQGSQKSTDKNKGTDAPQIAGCSPKAESPDIDISSLFTLDTTPSRQLDKAMVPSYKRGCQDVLDETMDDSKNSKSDDDDKCERPKMVSSCFNCGDSDHPLRDCPKPRNAKRIAMARAKKARGYKSERYHIEADQRFANLQPGKITKKLKDALRVRRGEVPFYIYKMRSLGYPPGWFEEAKMTSSGISLFDSDSDMTNAPKKDKDLTDGIDASKIIDYPGFNADPGADYHDGYKYYNAPALMPKFMKTEFINALGDKLVKSFVRRKTKPAETSSTVLDDKSISEGSPNVPQNDTEITEASVSTTVDITNTTDEDINLSTNVDSKERSQSPTLDELHAQQEQLLKEIGTVVDLTNSQSEETSQHLVNDEKSNETDNSLAPILVDDSSFNDNSMLPTTPVQNKEISNTTRKAIKDSHMGTPVYQFSPYEKLPAGENFKVGVSDVINFENLPDSTGAYEKMRVILKDVRKTILKYNDEGDDAVGESKQESRSKKRR